MGRVPLRNFVWALLPRAVRQTIFASPNYLHSSCRAGSALDAVDTEGRQYAVEGKHYCVRDFAGPVCDVRLCLFDGGAEGAAS